MQDTRGNNPKPFDDQDDVGFLEYASEASSSSSISQSYGIPQVHEYSGRAIWGSQFYRRGILLDSWADVLEGHAPRGKEFTDKFHALLAEKQIKGVSRKTDYLTATGIGAQRRTMSFYERNPILIAVYIAAQGTDLYISWRAFIQGKVSVWRVLILLILAFIFSLPQLLTFGGYYYFDYSGRINFYLSSLAPFIYVGNLIGLLVLISIWGYWRQGDILALLRHRIHELHYDDLMSLAATIHKTIIATADAMGIDTAKLEVREPFFKTRRRPRI